MARLSDDDPMHLGRDTPEALDHDIGMLAERARKMAAIYPRSAARLKEAAMCLTDLQADTMADILFAERSADDDRGNDMIAAQAHNDARREWAA